MIVKSSEGQPIKENDADPLHDWLFFDINRPIHGGKNPIIFIYRNVKDTIVSMYFMFKHIKQLNCAHPVANLDVFAEAFMEGHVHYGLYFHYFNSFWQHWQQPNFFHVSYERLHQDAAAEIRRLVDFLGNPLTEEQAQQVAHHTTFERMEKNDKLNMAK
ncbi:hypothetical protein RvY_12610 [Ramazzottius varieornatus]|uniref:Sulfotransferase domain-containing protein n=1 Tax=Ramazzottius varieornatus TaxID=947166 RepID=A0A1D1VQI8_RAMVA|nr:hypothetical protein RvY_12610 [Ramazzottius varieornatus]